MTTVLFYIFAMILELVRIPVALVGYSMPVQVTTGIVYFYSYLGYISGIFPVNTVILVFSSYISLIIGLYTLKVLLWIISFIPFVGSNINRWKSPRGY